MVTEHQNQTTPDEPPQPPPQSNSGSLGEVNHGPYSAGRKYPNPPEAQAYFAGPRYPNPPDKSIPDPKTLREQWMYATKRYCRWYGLTLGAPLLAGFAFFGLGWMIKGSNPLPTSTRDQTNPTPPPS